MIVVAGCEPLSDVEAVDVCVILNDLELEDHHRAEARGDGLADAVLGLRGSASDLLSRGTVRRRGVNLTASDYTREVSRGADRASATGEVGRMRLLVELARRLNVSPAVAVGKARRVRRIAIKRGLYVRRT